MVRAPDSWLKGRGFESLLERRENFLLQGRLSVLTLISVSVPPPCYHSSMINSVCGWWNWRQTSLCFRIPNAAEEWRQTRTTMPMERLMVWKSNNESYDNLPVCQQPHLALSVPFFQRLYTGIIWNEFISIWLCKKNCLHLNFVVMLNLFTSEINWFCVHTSTDTDTKVRQKWQSQMLILLPVPKHN